MICKLCKSGNTQITETIRARPEKETDFGIDAKDYLRTIYKCSDCGVYSSIHSFDFEKVYSGQYNLSTYNDKIVDHFKKIMSLPYEKSDNRQRAERVHKFMLAQGFDPKNTEILDVGSGLCVFLAAMQEYSYQGSCVDPDRSSIMLAREQVHVKNAFQGSVCDVPATYKFNLITLNKVLEHVTEPIEMLLQTLESLESGGVCYIELPDGENALKNAALIEREEFYIEHYFAFSKKSLEYLIGQTDLEICQIESILEPSGKYTVYAFTRKP